MDFLQHFLIGKPLEENGQDSLGVLTALQTVVLDDMQLLAGIDLELADGFLKETQDGPATDGAPAANAIRPAGKHYDYEVQSKVAALYGQIEQPFAQRWQADGRRAPGVRRLRLRQSHARRQHARRRHDVRRRPAVCSIGPRIAATTSRTSLRSSA